MESFVECPYWKKGLEYIKSHPEIADKLLYDTSKGS
jgi:hypothetical protein